MVASIDKINPCAWCARFRSLEALESIYFSLKKWDVPTVFVTVTIYSLRTFCSCICTETSPNFLASLGVSSRTLRIQQQRCDSQLLLAVMVTITVILAAKITSTTSIFRIHSQKHKRCIPAIGIANVELNVLGGWEFWWRPLLPLSDRV